MVIRFKPLLLSSSAELSIHFLHAKSPFVQPAIALQDHDPGATLPRNRGATEGTTEFAFSKTLLSKGPCRPRATQVKMALSELDLQQNWAHAHLGTGIWS